MLALRGALGQRRDDVLLRLARPFHLWVNPRGQEGLHVLQAGGWTGVEGGGQAGSGGSGDKRDTRAARLRAARQRAFFMSLPV